MKVVRVVTAITIRMDSSNVMGNSERIGASGESEMRTQTPAPVPASQGNCPDWRTVEWREEFREMRKVIDWLRSNCVTTKEAPASALPCGGFCELPGQDLNLDKENQNLLCYRYTTG